MKEKIMKRSEINNAIKWAEELLEKRKIFLPSFAHKTVEDWDAQRDALIKKVMLGWDVTDFGLGNFDKVGAVLFTVRNGELEEQNRVTYCEKYIFLKDGNCQEIPMHYHINKTEDIINRGGGILCVQVCNKNADETVDTVSPVEVYMDGVMRTFSPTDIIEIEPGASIRLTPYIYHRFYAKTGEGDLVVGEVSKVNDDHNDNIFASPTKRFCTTEEDEPKYRLLVCEY
jgi:D-lyxose ketol-isomerase